MSAKVIHDEGWSQVSRSLVGRGDKNCHFIGLKNDKKRHQKTIIVTLWRFECNLGFQLKAVVR